ncbi:MAG: cytochrome c-type biogenesis protein [Candidatus Zeuxoniibacter abyssi]|nr:MAG: cytochrome c-type biogenesis protein [Candidatus Persebacteraceae bacterium AB1(2)]
MKHIIALSFLFGAAVAAAGGIDPTEFDCPHDTARYQKLIQELRCLVCQNQTLSESSAPLAKDMRNVIKQMVRDDAPNAEIIGFMTARYGDFVLYRPPLAGHTVVLWAAPFIVVALALAFLPGFIRRRRSAVRRPDDNERAAAAARLLNE